MIAEAGLAALWLAAALSLLQLLLATGVLRGWFDGARAIRAVAIVQGVLTLIAFAMLILAFARTDLSVALVAENSHSAKPFLYKIAGTWGNHEGSMLMWVTILAVAGRKVGEGSAWADRLARTLATQNRQSSELRDSRRESPPAAASADPMPKVIMWMRATLMPHTCATSRLWDTARMALPRRVSLRKRNAPAVMTMAKTPSISM